MSAYNIKAIRSQFKEQGVFYTDTKLAEIMKGYLSGQVKEVYDPTCGDGQLLSVFPDDVQKYGQEINGEQLQVASERLTNFVGYCGDTLQEPHFVHQRFDCIMANYPFSIKWKQRPDDPIFAEAPAIAPKSKADYAFILHILHLLKPTGVAVTLNFPGILYRGNAEGKIRRWIIEQNWIERIVMIPSGYFVDTTITTALIVFRKNKKTTDVIFEDKELGKERTVPIEEIRQRDYCLSNYIERDRSEEQNINPIELEEETQASFIKGLKAQLELSSLTSSLNRRDFVTPLVREIEEIIKAYRNYKVKEL